MGETAAIAVAAIALAAAAVMTTVALRSSRTAARAAAELERATRGAVARGEEAVRNLATVREAFERLEHGVVVYDDAGAIVLRNAAATAIVSGSASGALVAAALDQLVAAAVGGEAGETSLDLFGPPRRTLRITAEPMSSQSGGVDGVVVVIDDVSERRRLEAVRRDFIANISHELKTPVGALALLAETLADEDDRDVTHRLAARMHDEAIRVGRIIEDLLDLSRIEAEEGAEREPVLVGEVIDEATQRLRASAEQRGVLLDIERAAPSLQVAGDRRQLVSAVHSLVENAITYTDGGGRVRVAAAERDGGVSITVSDTGVGIPARDLDRIFERFYRVDRARARATGGTGLGLSIVRHVATNHGGEVHVQSQEGSGSTFTLELPSAPPAPTTSTPALAAVDGEASW